MSDSLHSEYAGCACSGCTCSDCGHGHDDIPGSGGRPRIIKLAAGAVVFGAGLIVSHIFVENIYISLAAFIISYITLGGEIVIRAVKNILHGRVFDENFLMSAATIGAFIIGEYPEAVAVMLFYQTGEFFQERAVAKSKKSIADLMDIRPDCANLMTGSGITEVPPDAVNIGDTIIVKAGEKVPLDGVITSGEATLDVSALTGESAPRRASAPDAVLSGSVNTDGLLTIEVTRVFSESAVSKIISLVENASAKKAPIENFITRFARYYTPVVVGLAVLISLVPPLAGAGIFVEWLHRGLIFLVISCPCALVISIPLSFFAGIGAASRNGVLVKGGNYLEALSNLDLVVFDKTGTLTKGVFKVVATEPADGFTKEALLKTAAYAEAFSNHPVAKSIMHEYGPGLDKTILTEYRETAGLGVSVSAGGRAILAGNKEFMVKTGVSFTESTHHGTNVYVAADGAFMGCIVIADEIRQDSYAAVSSLKAKGVRKIIMLTGDSKDAAETVAAELKLDEAYSGLLPWQKVEKVEALGGQKRKNGKLAFAGDGINDAPVLAIADVGVAMGGLGSDAAIEAADVVLMTDEPSRLAEAVGLARYVKRIVRQNIAFILLVKAVFLLLGALGFANMWEAVFADVGVALLAVFNSMRIFSFYSRSN